MVVTIIAPQIPTAPRLLTLKFQSHPPTITFRMLPASVHLLTLLEVLVLCIGLQVSGLAFAGDPNGKKSFAAAITSRSERVIVDVGGLPGGMVNEIQIDLSNQSADDLVVHSVQADCSCTRPSISSGGRIGKGGLAKFNISLDTSQAGSFNRLVQLLENEIDPKSSQADLKSRVVAEIVLQGEIVAPLLADRTEFKIPAHNSPTSATMHLATSPLSEIDMSQAELVIIGANVENFVIQNASADSLDISLTFLLSESDFSEQKVGYVKLVGEGKMGQYKWEIPIKSSGPPRSKIVVKPNLRLEGDEFSGKIYIRSNYALNISPSTFYLVAEDGSKMEVECKRVSRTRGVACLEVGVPRKSVSDDWINSSVTLELQLTDGTCLKASYRFSSN